MLKYAEVRPRLALRRHLRLLWCSRVVAASERGGNNLKGNVHPSSRTKRLNVMSHEIEGRGLTWHRRTGCITACPVSPNGRDYNLVRLNIPGQRQDSGNGGRTWHRCTGFTAIGLRESPTISQQPACERFTLVQFCPNKFRGVGGETWHRRTGSITASRHTTAMSLPLNPVAEQRAFNKHPRPGFS